MMERGIQGSMAWPQCLDPFCRTQGHPCPITGLPKEKLVSAKDPLLGVAVEEASFLRKGVFKGFRGTQHFYKVQTVSVNSPATIPDPWSSEPNGKGRH